MKRIFIFHPLLLSAYPSLFLYSHNINKIPATYIFASIAYIAIFSSLIWLLLSLIVRNKDKAALLVSLFLSWMFFYGAFFEIGKGMMIGDFIIWRHKYIFTSWCLLFAVFGILILRKRGDFRNLTLISNVFASLLVIFCLITISVYIIKGGYQFPTGPPNIEEINSPGNETGISKDPESRPDIYFIILDAYAHIDILKKYYGYDNTLFYEYLKNKGFIITPKTRSNYAATKYSLASTMNMEYVHLKFGLREDLAHFPLYHRMTKDSKLMRFLKSKGYRWINVGFNNEYADVNFTYHASDQSGSLEYSRSFSKHLLTKHLLAMTFFYYFTSLADVSLDSDYRKSILFAFDKLPEIQKMEGPKFIFAHILAPHPPFAFGPQGEKNTLVQSIKMGPRELYKRQLIFISQKAQELIEALLKPGDTPPIIILQADHGMRISVPSDYAFDFRTLEESFKIFSAYYFPGNNHHALYESLSPVNTFRLILNEYFNAGFDLLKDESYLYVKDEFINVNDKFQAE